MDDYLDAMAMQLACLQMYWLRYGLPFVLYTVGFSTSPIQLPTLDSIKSLSMADVLELTGPYSSVMHLEMRLLRCKT